MSEALRSIEELERDRQEHLASGDLRTAASCDREIGIALAEAGQLEPALIRLESARHALAASDRPGDVAICDHCLGIVLARLGREHEALQRLEDARSAYAALHRYLAVADCEEHIGYALLALDRPGAAVSHLSHARRASGPPTASASARAPRWICRASAPRCAPASAADGRLAQRMREPPRDGSPPIPPELEWLGPVDAGSGSSSGCLLRQSSKRPFRSHPESRMPPWSGPPKLATIPSS
jgi:tetratricopeptide (TPR) repeat protein